MMGVNLLSYATRRRMGTEARKAADAVNDFGRDPIGEGKEERVSTTAFTTTTEELTGCQDYNRELKTLLDNKRDDASPVAEIGEHKPSVGAKDEGDGKKKRLPLEEITRYTMVKRIW